MILTACATATPAPNHRPCSKLLYLQPLLRQPPPIQGRSILLVVGPGEADGLAAMVKIFSAKYPQYEFVNAAVAGGSGTNAKAVLATRLAAGDPPDSWQAHAGQETIATYVAAGQVQPLDDLYKSTGFDKVLPATCCP